MYVTERVVEVSRVDVHRRRGESVPVSNAVGTSWVETARCVLRPLHAPTRRAKPSLGTVSGFADPN